MFELKNKQIAIIGLYDIVENYCSLINDGNNDLLYTGTNKFSSKILGSILFEDDENLYLRYIHTLITDEIFYKFINKEISLKEIIINCNSVFIVDKSYNNEIIDFALIPLVEIPIEFLPLKNSFCPDFVKKSSLDYTFSLKGKLADLHKAEPLVMSDTNNKVFSLLKSSSTFLEGLGITPIIYSEVALAGSFELNFEIELKENVNLFTKPTEDIKLFYFKFLNYLFEKLPNEPIDVIKKEELSSVELQLLSDELKELHNKRNVEISEEGSEQKIIDLITYSIDAIKDLEYKGYDRIEVKNKLTNGDKLPVGLIGNEYFNSVSQKVFKPEQNVKPDIIELDENPKEYKIQVYALNKETGNGGAYYINDDIVYKVNLHLRGKDDYHGTIYTKSLDESNSIVVKGIGKLVNGILKEVTINM